MNTKVNQKQPSLNNTLIKGTNFDAKILEEIEVLDLEGIIIERKLVMWIKIYNPKSNKYEVKKDIKISYDSFVDCSWIDFYLGIKAKVNYSVVKKNELKKIIQDRSDSIKTIIQFKTLGFKKIEDKRYFLYQGGAIQVNGDGDSNTSLVFDGDVRNCVFPTLDETDNQQELVKDFLGIKNIVPNNEMLGTLLLMSIMRAPLTTFKSNQATIWIIGKTGSRKTALSLVAMQCFGKDFKDSPSSWSSTPKAIEFQLQQACSILWLIDDYTDAIDKNDAKKIVELVVGGTGNSSKRVFKTSATDIADVSDIKALPLITAERIPSMIDSRKERSIFVSIKPNDVDNEILTQYQKMGQVGNLAKVTRLYISYILKNYDLIENKIGDVFEKYRYEAESNLGKKFHARTFSNYADMMLGLHYFLRFCKFRKYLTPEEVTDFKTCYSENLLRLLALQAVLHEATDIRKVVYNEFSDYLKTNFLLMEITDNQSSNIPVDKNLPTIGWIDHEHKKIYISTNKAQLLLDCLPDNLQKILTTGEKLFWKRLREYNLLVEVDNTSNKNVVRRTIKGKSRRVYSLAYSLIN